MRATVVAEKVLATSAAIRYRTISLPLSLIRPPANNHSHQSVAFPTTRATAIFPRTVPAAMIADVDSPVLERSVPNQRRRLSEYLNLLYRLRN